MSGMASLGSGGLQVASVPGVTLPEHGGLQKSHPSKSMPLHVLPVSHGIRPCPPRPASHLHGNCRRCHALGQEIQPLTLRELSELVQESVLGHLATLGRFEQEHPWE